MTQRKKNGWALVIGHGIGVLIGVIVITTTATPLWVGMAVGFAISLASTYIGVTVVGPNVPD